MDIKKGDCSSIFDDISHLGWSAVEIVAVQ